MYRIITISYNQPCPKGYIEVDCTSRSKEWGGLSPFTQCDVELYDIKAKNVENAWQFSKVYAQHDNNGTPNSNWFKWREKGLNDTYAHRYPMGKGNKPLYSFFNGEKYSYVEARKNLYFPLYIQFCQNNPTFNRLKDLYQDGEQIAIRDFDVYYLGDKDLIEAVNDPTRKAGHGFVLYHLLTNMPYK